MTRTGKNTRVGSWVEAKAGDDVTVTTAPVPLERLERKPQPGGEPRWWLDFIAARCAAHLPFPADTAERERLLYRVAIELFGTPVERRKMPPLSPTARRTRSIRWQSACSSRGRHAVHRPLTIRPDEIPRPPRRPRCREKTAHRQQPWTLHARRKYPSSPSPAAPSANAS